MPISGNEEYLVETELISNAVSMNYTKNDSTGVYSINYTRMNPLAVTQADMYLVLRSSAPDGTYFDTSVFSDAVLPAGYSGLQYYLDIPADGDGRIKSGYATKFQVTADISYSSTTAPPNLSVELVLRAQTDVYGSIYSVDKQFKLASNNTALINVITENGGDTISGGGGTGNYHLEDSPVNYGGDEGVRITNEGNPNDGITAGNNGKANITLELPEGKSFIIAIGFVKGNQPQSMNITLTVNNQKQLEFRPLDLPNDHGATYTLYCYKANGVATYSYDKPADSLWMNYSGTIKISIDASSNMHLNSATTFDLVFKPVV